MILVATCLFGLEKQLGEEIDALGCKRLDTMDGRVTFEGSELDLARANVRWRLAERVFIRVGQFPARSFTVTGISTAPLTALTISRILSGHLISADPSPFL